jgi:hypothetical protein
MNVKVKINDTSEINASFVIWERKGDEWFILWMDDNDPKDAQGFLPYHSMRVKDEEEAKMLYCKWNDAYINSPEYLADFNSEEYLKDIARRRDFGDFDLLDTADFR